MTDGIKLPRIRCAVCDKLVDKVAVDFDPYLEKHRILVMCHGDRDVMEAGSYQIQEDPEFWRAVAEGRIEGVAFHNQKTGQRAAHAARTSTALDVAPELPHIHHRATTDPTPAIVAEARVIQADNHLLLRLPIAPFHRPAGNAVGRFRSR